MADSNVDVKFGANITELISKLNEVSSKMNESSAKVAEEAHKMSESFSSVQEGISSAFGKIGMAFGALTAAMAGGEAFENAIEKTMELSGEASKLSKSLGMPVTAAGALGDTLGNIGSSAEQYIGISQRLGRQMKTNEDGLVAMGVAVRNADGSYRNQQDVMMDALGVLNTYAEGTDRNQAAMAIFGGRVGDINGLLRLNNEKLQETADRQRELGSEVTPQNVKAMRDYKDTMADVGDSMNAVWKTIGDVMLPRMTKMGDFFNDIAPAAVRVMSNAMLSFIDVMDAVGEVVVLVVNTILAPFKAVGELLSTIFGSGGETMSALQLFVNMLTVIEMAVSSVAYAVKVLVLDIETLGRIMAHPLEIKSTLADANQQLDKLGRDYVATMEKMATKSILPPIKAKEETPDKPKGVAKFEGIESVATDTKQAEVSQMKQYEEQLLKNKLYLARLGREMTKEEEAKYWSEVRDFMQKGSADYQTVTKKMETDELSDLTKNIKAKKTLLEMEAAEEEKSLLREIGVAEQESKHQLALGNITAEQDLANQRAYENAKFEIMQAAQAKRISLQLKESTGGKINDPVALQKQLDTMANLQQTHEDKMAEIQRKSVEENKKRWEGMMAPITQTISGSINGMIQGTTTMQKSIQNLEKNMLASFVDTMVQKLAKTVATNIAEITSTQTKNTIIMASDSSTTGVAVAAKSKEATAIVSANASEGASGAAASVAAIPVVGPAMAAISFASTMALIMGAMSGIKSSAGGEWQVSSDRLNFVHKDETILPASIASPMRKAFEEGAFSDKAKTDNQTINNQSSQSGALTIHINAIDSQGVKQFFDKHGSTIVDTLRGQKRNFNTGGLM